MAKKTQKLPKKVAPLFPDLHYVSDRKGARVSKKQRLMANAAIGKQPKQELAALDEILHPKSPAAKPSRLHLMSFQQKKVGLFIIGFLIVALAFLPIISG